jgi:hypothetical protein
MKKTLLFLGLFMMLAFPMVAAAGDLTHAFENSTGYRLLNITSVGDLEVTQDVYARNFIGNGTQLTFPECADGEVMTYNSTDGVFCTTPETTGIWTDNGDYIYPTTTGANVSVRSGGYFQVKETGDTYSLMDVDPTTNTTTIRNKLLFKSFEGDDMFSFSVDVGGGTSAAGADPNLNVFYFQNQETYFGLPSSLGGLASGNVTIFDDAADSYALRYVDDGSFDVGSSDFNFEQGLSTDGNVALNNGANVTFDDGSTIYSTAGVMTFRSGV